MSLSRRTVLGSVAASLAGRALPALADTSEQTVRVGIDMSLTGSDAQAAAKSRAGAVLAFEEANAARAIPGVRIEVVTLDDGTATAGQYDPAQAAINARKMVSDKRVVAAIGPQMSGAGKAMAPILSMGGLATITPSSTSPDITDPAFAAQYRPSGKAIYFRTVTTDAYQGPNMANFYVETLKARRIYILDDGGAYGVGMADAFESEARKKGAEVRRARPARSQGGRLLGGADKHQVARRRCAVFRRRQPGGREADEAGVRHRAGHHQGRRRRHLRARHPDRRRLPGGRGLVRDDRLAARAGRRGRARIRAALHGAVRHDARTIRRSPRTTARSSSSTRSSEYRRAETR